MSTPLRPRFAGRPPVKPTRAMPDERREALLGQLEKLILSHGFSDLTLDQVAAELRCSKSALYSLAGSKEQLVTTVVKRFFREATAKIEQKVEPIADPREQVVAYLAGVGDEMRRMSPNCYEDMVRFPVTREIYELNSRAAADHVREMIQDGIKQAVFRPLHARFIGEAVSVLIESIQHGGLLERVGLSSGDAYAELSSLVLGALVNGNGPEGSRRGTSR
jgi:AcrR family transcriptional regulator